MSVLGTERRKQVRQAATDKDHTCSPTNLKNPSQSRSHASSQRCAYHPDHSRVTVLIAPAFQPKKRVFYGAFVHALSNRKLEYQEQSILAVDDNGVIAFIQHNVKAEEIPSLLSLQKGWADAEVVRLKRGEFLIPG